MRIRSLQTLAVALALGALAAGCAGSHGAAPSLPSFTQSVQGGSNRHTAAVAPGGDVVAINAGGSASGTFAADEDYAAGAFTYNTSNAINTSAIASPAPQAVYQSEREGTGITYTIPGLTAGGSYTVRLSFAEIFWTAAGKRVFNVAVNGTQVLSNFDIFASAGGANTAINRSFPATANSSGQIVITFTTVTDHAAVDAVEILAPTGTATPTPTPIPSASASAAPSPVTSGLYINAGGGATGSFVADEDYAAGPYTYSVTNAIDTSGVASPAPQAVYQTQRTGSAITYTIPSLTAGKSYGVRLDFAELYWNAAGQRVFNVSINGTKVLANFDIYATAGAEYRAVAKSFTATANSSGQIVIAFTAVTDNPTVNGIEITSTATATSAPSSAPTTQPTTAPTTAPSSAPSSSALVDWPTYGFDVARDGYNPSTTAFTPASLGNLHKVWNTTLVSGAQSQPVVATNVAGHPAMLILGTGNGYEQAVDGMTGATIWTTNLGQQNDGACGSSGVGGTAQYVASTGSIFVAAGNGGAVPNHDILYQLNVATGAIVNKLDLSTYLLTNETTSQHAGITYANGTIYVGTSSNCVEASWRGSVIAVNPSTMQVENRFFLTWNQSGPYSGGSGSYGGGSVWGWGGVSADPSGHIYVGGGNGATQNTTSGTNEAPFVNAPAENIGYAEHVTELDSGLDSIIGAIAPVLNFSIGGKDLDETGTPVVFQPTGCDQLVASQGKGGTLVVADTANWGEGAIGNFTFSEPSALGNYMGNPGYSPRTGLLYAPVNSGTDSMYPPGLAAIGGCGSNVAWHTQFGPDSFGYQSDGASPRSMPIATAGGVVFIGTPCTPSGSTCGTPGARDGAVWALDASTGTVLNGGNPVVMTPDTLRMAPTIDGQWMWICDGSGNVYGYTVNSAITAKTSRATVKRLPQFRYRG